MMALHRAAKLTQSIREDATLPHAKLLLLEVGVFL